MKKFVVLFLLSAVIADARLINVTSFNIVGSLYNAVAGDTLLLATDTFNFPLVSPSHDGTLDSPIVVQGAGTTKTCIYGCGNGSCEGFVWYPKHWIWENIHFKGDGTNNHLFHLGPGARGYVTWRNCHFSGVADKAIKVDFSAYSGPTNVWPDYLLLENCTMNVQKGGLMNNDGGDFLTCRGNVTYGFDSNPNVLYVYFSKGGLAYTLFENNVLWGGDIGPLSFGGGSMYVPGTYFRHDSDLAVPLSIPFKTCELWRSVIRNNVVISGAAGVAVSNVYDCEIYNNTFINCGYALRCQNHHSTGPKNFKFYNNLMVSCGGFSNATGWTIDTTKNLWTTQSPTNLFASWSAVEPGASNDYHIKTAMTGTVSTGIAPYAHSTWPEFNDLLSASFYDLYGTVRNVAPRIGAAEVQSGPSVEGYGEGAVVDGVDLNVVPNPANPTAALQLTLDKRLRLVDAGVYDIRGRHVRSLYYGPMEKGAQVLRWDGRNHFNRLMASGTYLFRVSLGKEVLYKKFELVR